MVRWVLVVVEANKRIFNCSSIPTDEDISYIVDKFSQIGIDITLNCVYNDSRDTNFIMRFISYAKSLGVNKVCFRYDSNTGFVGSTMVERYIGTVYKCKAETSCPVCRTSNYIIGGVDVSFKTGLNETNIDSEFLYEAIFHPNGVLTSDWAGKNEIVLNKVEEDDKYVNLSTTGKGCGAGGCR